VRIALVGCWHDDNRGDGAILLGLIQDLYALHPGVQLRAFSIFSDERGPFATAFRHVRSIFPQIETYTSPIGDIYNPNIGHIRRIFRAKSLMIGPLGWGIPPGRPSLAPLIGSDRIISVGGYRFKADRGDLIDLIRLLFHSLPLLLAQRYEKPYVIDAQSIGPIRGSLHRKIVRRALGGARLIGVREWPSFAEVRSLGPAARLVCVPDAALAVDPIASDRVLGFMRAHNLTDRPYIVLAPRQWFFENRDKYRAYIDTMARFVRELSRDGHRVVLVAHALGPIPREDDRRACREIAVRAGAPPPLIVAEDWNPMELAAFYGRAAALVGGRLHAALLAARAGAPPIAIAYEGTKTQGIMDMIGLEDFVLHISALDYPGLIRIFDKMMAEKDAIKPALSDRIRALREIRREFVRRMVEE